MKKAVLIINLGSPEKPTIFSVWKFLKEFLNDGRVIDIPSVIRFFLVNFIIIPLRVRNSTKEYKKLWKLFGSSPLIHYTDKLTSKLNEKSGDLYDYYYAMRYQQPSIKSVLNNIYDKNYDEIIILPLYPQYASASTGSTIEECYNVMKTWWNSPKIKIINQFFDDDGYINCCVQNAKKINYKKYDHILFSYHGLPERHVDKTYTNKTLCQDNDCEYGVTDKNKFCYKATVYETTKLIADKLNLDKSKYEVTFQSRLTNKWLDPFTDKVLEELPLNNHKKVLVFSPAFTADCLETIIEIGDEYQELFVEAGGEILDYVPSLNYSDKWAESIIDIANLGDNNV